MIKHDKKDKMAILTGGLILLMAILAATWATDESYGPKVIVYAAITLGIGFLVPKILFVLEKKNTWLYEKRCKVNATVNATTIKKHIITFLSAFITCIMVYHLRYIDYAAIIIIGIIVGIITALAEFFTSKKGSEDCDIESLDK